MVWRPSVLLACVALVGCVDLSRPSSLVTVVIQDSSSPAPPDADSPDTDSPDADSPDGGAPDVTGPTDMLVPRDQAPADRPAADAPAADAPAAEAPPPPAPDAAPDLAADAAPDTGGCTTENQCDPGFSCINQMCAPLPGLVLQWKLDETSGTVASDTSGSGFDGTYGGATGMPATASSVPAMQFPDPGSRQFTGSSRHEVRLANMDTSLRRTNDITISAWFRTTQITDSNGYAEIFSLGDGCILYIGRNEVGFFKRVAPGDYRDSTASMTGHLDGRWHHLAGVTTTAAMTLYFDGKPAVTVAQGGSVTYPSSPAVLVGRDFDPMYGWYFDGFIDDVRAYDRALSATEITKLAAGGR
jgi:hypothetical protein